MADYNGTPGDDTYFGTPSDDVINGNDGNDMLEGRGGNDRIFGGNGDDILKGGAGLDIVDGGDGNDSLNVGVSTDIVAGDRFIGGSGIDTIYVSTSYPEEFPTTDLTVAIIDRDVERLVSSGGSVRLTVAQLNQFQTVQGIFQIADSGTIDLTGNRVAVNASFRLADGTNNVTLAGNVLNELVSVTGGSGVDTIIGSESRDALTGGSGDDVLDGRGGDDSLVGGDGDDITRGGAGNDTFTDGLGADTIDGGSGNDIVYLDFENGFSALDQVSGGSGVDTLNIAISPYGNRILDFSTLKIADDFEILNANFANLVVSVERLTRFQSVAVTGITLTTGGNFTLSGTLSAQRFTLSAFGNGVDLSAGGPANYRVSGGNGDDTIIGSAYSDTFTGGAGNDVIRGGDGGDVINGGSGVNILDGGVGNDTLQVEEASIAAAGSRFTGGTGTDTLFINGPDNGYNTVLADLTAATIDADIEQLRGNNLAGAILTTAQLSQFSSINLQTVRVATGGTIDLTGKSFTGYLLLSNIGNTVIFSGSDIRPYEITGGSGNDTISASGSTINLTIRAGDGDDVVTTGSGDDFLVGGAGNDTIRGGAGADSFYDDAGDDTYDGGAGSDIFNISTLTTAADRFIGGDGIDYIYINVPGTSIDLSMLDFGDVEGISGQDLRLSGSQASRFSYIRTSTLTLTSAGSLTLRDNRFEGFTINLSAAGNAVDLSGSTRYYSVTGGIGDDIIIGGAGADSLFGGGGADVIIGGQGDDQIGGGAGIDRLDGGLGNDRYFVDRPEDLVFEAVGEGRDTVVSQGAGFYLYANVENLELAPEAGNGFGVGNELDNAITGNSGSNLLIGGGGQDTIRGGGGADSIFGEAGDDQLFGDAGIDYIVGGAGRDTIDGGDNPDSIYGGDGDDILNGGFGFHTDILVGGDGNDQLNGSTSGFGDYDLMDGGAGDDTYIVDTPDDLTFEAVGGGIDTVIAQIDGGGYYLYANVDNLVLNGNTVFGVGNELDNRLTGSDSSNLLLGGAGNDVIDGKGGNDLLYGEAGADIFRFSRGTGGDVIGDFQHGVDKIDVSNFFTSYAQLMANLVENGGSSAVNLGNGDLFVILGVANSTLSASDFIFG